MVLRIEQVANDSETVLRLSGRIASEDVQQLKAKIGLEKQPVALDLDEVRLVDLDAAHFLAGAERNGIELRHVPAFIREWIRQEKQRVVELEKRTPKERR